MYAFFAGIGTILAPRVITKEATSNPDFPNTLAPASTVKVTQDKLSILGNGVEGLKDYIDAWYQSSIGVSSP